MPLRVGFLVQDIGAIYGAERATVDLVRGLRAHGGVAPVVIRLEETRLGLAASPYHDALRATGARVETIPVASAFSLDGIRRLRRFLSTEALPILHTVGPKADLHGWWAARGRARLVSTVHGWLFRPDLKERLHEEVNRRVLRRFDRVVVLSRFYEDLLLRAGVRRERLARIPSGFDPASLDLAAGPPRFAAGYLGRLSEEKQPGVLLEAIRRLVARGCRERFLLAGDGPLRAGLEATLRGSGLSAQVELVPYRPRAEFFADVRVFVLPSRVENLPYTVLEAMATAKPVVASRAGGIPDLVEHGQTGLLVPPGDPDALAAALESLLADPARAEVLGRAGRARLEAEFSPDRQIQDMVAIYQGI